MKRISTEGMKTTDSLNCSPLKKALISIETTSPEVSSAVITETVPASKLVSRFSEILGQCDTLLREVGSIPFKLFCQTCATDLKACIEFLGDFSRLHQPLSNEINRASLVNTLNQMPNLQASLISELHSLRARWRVHLWLQNNQTTVTWLQQRQAFYPLLLAMGLAKIDIDWLIEAPNHHQAICDSANQTRVLNFSASLAIIDKTLATLPKQINNAILQMLPFIQEKMAQSFFKALATKQLRPSFYSYVENNAACQILINQLYKHKNALLNLLSETDHHSVFSDMRKLQYYQPVITPLLTAYLNDRLNMLYKLALIGSSAPAEEKTLLTVLTWMEKNREILQANASNNNPWKRWLMQEKAHKATLRKFSKSLLTLISENNCIDVRGLNKDDAGELRKKAALQANKIDKILRENRSELAGLVQKYQISDYQTLVECYTLDTLGFCKGPNGQLIQQKPFANPAECYQDAIMGLSAKDRNSEISCQESDVLMYEFLYYNPQITAYIATRLDQLDPIIQAYHHYELSLLAPIHIPTSPTEVRASRKKIAAYNEQEGVNQQPIPLTLSPVQPNSPDAVETFVPKIRVKKRPMRSLADGENAPPATAEFKI